MTAQLTATLTADYQAFADAVAVVGLAVPKHAPLPVLTGVKITAQDGATVISAYDYEVSVTATLAHTASGEGSTLVYHSELRKLLTGLTKGAGRKALAEMPVALDLDSTPTLRVNGYTMPLVPLPLEDYPVLPATPPAVATVEVADLVAAMQRAAVARGDDTLQPIFTSAQVIVEPGSVWLECCDRFRLTRGHVPAHTSSRKRRVMLPHARTLQLLLQTLPASGTVTIGYDDDQGVMSLTCQHITATLRCLEGPYPNTERFYQTTAFISLVVQRADLLRATERAHAVTAAKDLAPHVRLDVENTGTGCTVRVSPVLPEHDDKVTVPSLPAESTNPTPYRIGFNPKYLVDALKNFDGDTIALHIHDNSAQPALITDTVDGLTTPTDYRHLVMSIRVPD